MFRSLIGFAVFAVISIFLVKMLFGLFGLVLGLLGTVLWLAFVGLRDLPDPEAVRAGHRRSGAGDGGAGRVLSVILSERRRPWRRSAPRCAQDDSPASSG